MIIGAAGTVVADGSGDVIGVTGFVFALAIGVYYTFWMALILSLSSLATLRRLATGPRQFSWRS
ncbi:hypothetical protein [Microlunatus elymi]|uniref:hypothetical protein n=1 Tax=Microlunatus elymi TaxID=2596828 RepID=UPI00143D6D18|nr:hypothetical protein [Microlunatus elymi]